MPRAGCGARCSSEPGTEWTRFTRRQQAGRHSCREHSVTVLAEDRVRRAHAASFILQFCLHCFLLFLSLYLPLPVVWHTSMGHLAVYGTNSIPYWVYAKHNILLTNSGTIPYFSVVCRVEWTNQSEWDMWPSRAGHPRACFCWAWQK